MRNPIPFERLRQLRETRMTVNRLADVIHTRHPDTTLTAAEIDAMEHDGRDDLTITETAQLAEALHVSPVELMCDCSQPFVKADEGPFEGMNAMDVMALMDMRDLPKGGGMGVRMNLAIELEQFLIAADQFDHTPVGQSALGVQAAELILARIPKLVDLLSSQSVTIPNDIANQVRHAEAVCRKVVRKQG